MTTSLPRHVPVLSNAVMEALRPVFAPEGAEAGNVPCGAADAVLLDGTLGLGGHARRFLEEFPRARLIGLDQDPQALDSAREALAPYGSRFRAIAGNFREAERLLEGEGLSPVRGLLVDLGVSNLQIALPERGFSFQGEGPLDMRMNPTNGESAAELLARCDLRELTRILREYGEEPHAFRIAQGILRVRERGELPRTTGALVELIRNVLPAPVQRKMGGHPARRVFQALRIAVNDELGALEDLLDQLPRIVGEGGIAIAIAYHSLEDRIVKRAFRALEAEGRGKSVPRRAIVPSEEEIAENYKARSAKMRVFRFGRLLAQGRGFR